jgi:hypothetical protein
MVSKWRGQGGRVVMVTYTLRHTFTDGLSDLVRDLGRVRRKFVSGNLAQKIRERAGSIGSVRAYEVTYGASGWHPHIHELHFVSCECNVERFGNDMWCRWRDSVARCGLPAVSRQAFDVTDCDTLVSQYLSKFGHDPKWSEAAELSKQVSKIGKSSVRFTPLQLLAAYTGVMSDPFAGAAWAEYALAMKGHRQLRTSNGLRDRLGMGDELSDDEVMEKRETEAVYLAHLSQDEWRAVVGNDCRGELLQLAAAADLAGVQALVFQLSEMAAAVRPQREAIERRIRSGDEVCSG